MPTQLSDPGTTTGYVHGLGHGVGFEVHELPHFRSVGPSATAPSQRGDVFTLEPGLYDPSAGWAVRLEDLVYLGGRGLENLTPLPYDLDPRAWTRTAPRGTGVGADRSATVARTRLARFVDEWVDSGDVTAVFAAVARGDRTLWSTGSRGAREHRRRPRDLCSTRPRSPSRGWRRSRCVSTPPASFRCRPRSGRCGPSAHRRSRALRSRVCSSTGPASKRGHRSIAARWTEATPSACWCRERCCRTRCASGCTRCRERDSRARRARGAAGSLAVAIARDAVRASRHPAHRAIAAPPSWPRHRQPPGQRYSDLDYILWGFAAERRLGVELAELLRRRVLDPLGIDGVAIAPGPRAGVVPCFCDNGREVELAAQQRLRVAHRGPPSVGEPQDGNARFLGGLGAHAGLFVERRRGVGARPRVAARARRRESAAAARGSVAALAGRAEYALGWAHRRVGGSAGRALSRAAFGHIGFTGGSLWVDPESRSVLALLAHRRSPAVELNTARRRFHALAAALR